MNKPNWYIWQRPGPNHLGVEYWSRLGSYVPAQILCLGLPWPGADIHQHKRLATPVISSQFPNGVVVLDPELQAKHANLTVRDQTQIQHTFAHDLYMSYIWSRKVSSNLWLGRLIFTNLWFVQGVCCSENNGIVSNGHTQPIVFSADYPHGRQRS